MAALSNEECKLLILDLATSLTDTLHCLNKNSITYINAMKSLDAFHKISADLFTKPNMDSENHNNGFN